MPHRWRQFKLSNDPAFVEKVEDVVGLYVDPPEHAVVLSIDEKSQIQNRAKAMRVLKARIREIEERERDKERAETRRSQVGTGDRSEKIRTYNFPQSRITDHRINYTAHNLGEVLDGDLEDLIEELTRVFREQALQEQGTAE